MCVRFDSDDADYVAWLDENTGGFVFNDFPGERVLHRTTCTHLRRDADSGRRTVSGKICCEDMLRTIQGSFGRAPDDCWYCRSVGTGCW